jgi:putative hydrolase of the HAD superfamily
VSRRTLVFDVGGVIVRWQPLDLMREHLPSVATDEASARAAAAQVFQSWSSSADWVAFDRGRIEPGPLADRIAARTGYPCAELAALIAAIPAHLQPMPESLALIERARAAGHRLALLSNMPRPYADHLEAEHACFGWFEHRSWSGRLGMVKPERAIFDHVRSTLSLDADDALFIDDHAGNVEAAADCGWNALQFSSAAQCEAELRAGGWL